MGCTEGLRSNKTAGPLKCHKPIVNPRNQSNYPKPIRMPECKCRTFAEKRTAVWMQMLIHVKMHPQCKGNGSPATSKQTP